MNFKRAFYHSSRLTLVTFVLWLVVVAPAYYFAGANGVVGAGIAAVLCLAPGWIVFFLSGCFSAEKQQAWVALGGTGLRLLFVLGGTLVVQAVRPDFGLAGFLVWLVVFYSATLAMETFFLLGKVKSMESPLGLEGGDAMGAVLGPGHQKG